MLLLADVMVHTLATCAWSGIATCTTGADHDLALPGQPLPLFLAVHSIFRVLTRVVKLSNKHTYHPSTAMGCVIGSAVGSA